MTPPPIRLLNNHLPIIPLPMHKQQQKARDGKEDAIHDAKRKARLQHRTMLVCVQMERRLPGNTIIVDGDGEIAVGGEVGAVRIAYVTELVNASDEGADEAEVDEGDEEGRVPRRFAAEDGRDGPGGSEDGDDEENEDRVGGEQVLAFELVDEVGLLNEFEYALVSIGAPLESRRLTSMPNVGIRVMISRKRQKLNSKPPIILTVLISCSPDRWLSGPQV